MSKADTRAEMLLAMLSAEVGHTAADRAMRAALARAKAASKRGPTAITRRMLEAMWDVVDKRKATTSNHALYIAMEDVMAEKGFHHQPGSITRSLERHWPAYRARKKGEKARRLARLLEPPLSGTLFGLTQAALSSLDRQDTPVIVSVSTIE